MKTDSSYSFQFNEMARPEGFEPPTLCLEGRRSFQLSYGRVDGNCLSLRRCMHSLQRANSCVCLLGIPTPSAPQAGGCVFSLILQIEKVSPFSDARLGPPWGALARSDSLNV